MRGKKLIQLIKALDLLSRPQGATRLDLAEKLNVTDRTVSRILNMMQALNFPVVDDKEPLEKQKSWHLEPSYVMKLPNITLPDISLNLPEIISLYMLKGEATVFNGTEIDRQITSAMSKLMYFVPEKTRSELSNLKRIFISKSISAKNYQGKEAIITPLTESIINRTSLMISYHSFYDDEIKEYEIGPLHFYENNGGLYIFAIKMKDRAIRSYAVERIRRILALDQDVDYPDDFDPVETLDSAFDMTHGQPVTVKIWFSKNEARYIKERKWAKNQQIEDHADGSVTLSMTTSGYRDVKRWIMSFGKEARLLEPKDMKQEIEDELKIILKGMKKSE
ncbi:MAG: WYL domain-containing protein [Proteobacteria bacterium]|nr:WYL domain-containing protein [Pseudomonadota bacterium]